MGWTYLSIPKLQPLKFGNGWVISSHTLLGMWLLIHAVNPYYYSQESLVELHIPYEHYGFRSCEWRGTDDTYMVLCISKVYYLRIITNWWPHQHDMAVNHGWDFHRKEFLSLSLSANSSRVDSRPTHLYNHKKHSLCIDRTSYFSHPVNFDLYVQFRKDI